MKDGGVFVNFQYDAKGGAGAMEEIIHDLRGKVSHAGGIPSWFGLPRGTVWAVKGHPWREVSSEP